MSPWPPPGVLIDERQAWQRRAREHRRRFNYCALCEARRAKLGPFTFNPPLEVHHRRGRGILSAIGYENASELMTLCCPCHDRITTAHRRLGRQRGQINSRGRTIDPRGYSFTIAEVTDAAHPRYVRRAIRRTLFGLPKELT